MGYGLAGFFGVLALFFWDRWNKESEEVKELNKRIRELNRELHNLKNPYNTY